MPGFSLGEFLVPTPALADNHLVFIQAKSVDGLLLVLLLYLQILEQVFTSVPPGGLCPAHSVSHEHLLR